MIRATQNHYPKVPPIRATSTEEYEFHLLSMKLGSISMVLRRASQTFRRFTCTLNLLLGFDVAMLLEREVYPAGVSWSACERRTRLAVSSLSRHVDATVFWFR